MHDTSVFYQMMQEPLSKEEWKKALTLLMFLKKKNDTTVKVQICADGQGSWSKQDTTLPTVLMELVFITAVVDTHKGCNIACFDIAGAFLHADLDKNITKILKRKLSKLMVHVAPNLYRKYITVDRQGTAILYVKMQKAIYGLLRSALLFYKKLAADLESIGFVLNPIDPWICTQGH